MISENKKFTRDKRMKNFKFLFLIILLFIFISSCDFIDDINPNVIAKVGDKKIYYDKLKKEIIAENGDVKLTKPLVLFYINEKINEIILEEEFNKLKMKITKKDIEQQSDIVKLNPEALRKRIIFEKVKKYVVRKLTYPSDEECLKYYKTHINIFNHYDKVRLRYIVSDEYNLCKKIYSMIKKEKNFDKVLKKIKLKYAFNGIIKVKDIPEEIKEQIDYTKNNSFWLVKTKDRCYVLECLEYLKNVPVSFKEAKYLIREKLLMEKQTKLFNLWLKKQREKRKIKIYYNKIKT